MKMGVQPHDDADLQHDNLPVSNMRIGLKLIGLVRKEIVMSATWKIEACELQRLLAGIEGPWHGAVSSLLGSIPINGSR